MGRVSAILAARVKQTLRDNDPFDRLGFQSFCLREPTPPAARSRGISAGSAGAVLYAQDQETAMSLPLGLNQCTRAFAKRSRRGLFAGKQPNFGDNVSEDGKNRTKRKWSPNVQNKRIYSETLDKMIPFRVTTTALRTIDKVGGLDNYLLYTREEKLASDVGLKWKEIILSVKTEREAAAVASGGSGSLLPPAARQ